MTKKSKKIKDKKILATKVISNLQKVYENPQCALNHSSAWQLLVATILSAQCTDKRVNLVTPVLFENLKTIKDFATAEQTKVEKLIKSTGFYKNKAKNLIACANMIIDKYEGKVPNNMQELITLPGVGRKTASVVLGTCFNKAEGIVVDTHVKRLSYRLGLTNETSPEKIEMELMKIINKKHWIIFSHLLILHGRNRCKARKADCENCEITNICEKKLK